MFALLKASAGRVFKTKVGIALVGALVVGGGGTAMAMAGANVPLLSSFVAPGAAASPTAHSDDSADATTAAGQDDRDGNSTSCTGKASATGAAATPTAHSDDSADATTVAGQDDRDGNENESAAEDQNEAKCAGSAEPTHTPGSDDGSEATRTPGSDGGSEATHTPQPTKGPGDD